MNLNVQLRPNASGLGADPAALRNPGAAPALPFAGLLQGAAQAEARRAEGAAYGGSAFDVPAARREPEPAPRAPEGRAAGVREPARPAARDADPNDAPRKPDEARAQDGDASSEPAAPSRGAERRSAAVERREAREPARGSRRADAAHIDKDDATTTDAVADPHAARAQADAAHADGPAPVLPEAARPVLEWLARFGRGAAAADSPSAVQLPGDTATLPGVDATLPTSPEAGLPGVAAVASTKGGLTEPGLDAASTNPTDALQDAAADAGTTFGLPGSSQPHAVAAQAVTETLAKPTEAAPAIEARHPLAPLAGSAAPNAAPAAAAVAQVSLPTPLASPDFSAALAARLTTLAREGVHQAQLQLNPAEMGPIAVQIVMDGSQAQIDFAAAQAGTREALQAGLPALAAALHAAGLTLSGGGVFEQRQSGGREADAPARDRDAGPADAEAPPNGRPVALGRPQGLLDTYA